MGTIYRNKIKEGPVDSIPIRILPDGIPIKINERIILGDRHITLSISPKRIGLVAWIKHKAEDFIIKTLLNSLNADQSLRAALKQLIDPGKHN